jgi:hypothetical protein
MPLHELEILNPYLRVDKLLQIRYDVGSTSAGQSPEQALVFPAEAEEDEQAIFRYWKVLCVQERRSGRAVHPT